jgi:sugar phosphate isomerase/epimerase
VTIAAAGVTTSLNSLNASPRFGLPPRLPALVDAAAMAGFDAVGLDVAAVRAHAAEGLEPAALAGRLQCAGLACAELSLVRVEGDAAADRDELQSVLPLVHALRPMFLQVIVAEPAALATSAGLTAVRSGLARAVDALAGTSTRLTLEYAPMLAVPGIAAALDLLDRPDLAAVQLCVDTWHVVRGPDTWDDLAGLPVARLGYVQLADCGPVAWGDLREESLDHRLMPGDGGAPLDRIAMVLGARGFAGVVSVEVLSRYWRTRGLDETAAAALAGLRAVWAAGSRITPVSP